MQDRLQECCLANYSQRQDSCENRTRRHYLVCTNIFCGFYDVRVVRLKVRKHKCNGEHYRILYTPVVQRVA